MITHAQVDLGSRNDSELLISIVSKTKDRLHRFGLWLRSLATDKGFYSAENLKWSKDERLTNYVAPRHLSNIKGPFAREAFRYEAERDRFICPEGKILRFRQCGTELPHLRRYRARVKDCHLCPQKVLCTKGRARTVQRSIVDMVKVKAVGEQGSY